MRPDCRTRSLLPHTANDIVVVLQQCSLRCATNLSRNAIFQELGRIVGAAVGVADLPMGDDIPRRSRCIYGISRIAKPQPCQSSEPNAKHFRHEYLLSRTIERAACARHLPHSLCRNDTSATGITVSTSALPRDRSSVYAPSYPNFVWAFGEGRATALLQDWRRGLARNSHQYHDQCGAGRDSGKDSGLFGTRRIRTAHVRFIRSESATCDPGPLRTT